MAKPTDEQILIAVASSQYMMTYVVANVLRRKFNGLPTAWVRRRLAAMEKLGKVQRIPSSYARQICWAIPKEAP